MCLYNKCVCISERAVKQACVELRPQFRSLANICSGKGFIPRRRGGERG